MQVYYKEEGGSCVRVQVSDQSSVIDIPHDQGRGPNSVHQYMGIDNGLHGFIYL